MKMQYRAAQIETGYDPETRSLPIVWTTGATVRRWGYDPVSERYGEFDEELVVSTESVDMARLASGNAPILDSHMAGGLRNVIGRLAEASVDGGVGTGLAILSGADDVAPIRQRVEDGTLRNISVGYSIVEAERVDDPDRAVPLLRVTRWQPAEVSMVAVGADPSATVRDAQSAVQWRGLFEPEAEPEAGPDDIQAAASEMARALGMTLAGPVDASTREAAIQEVFKMAQAQQAPPTAGVSPTIEAGVDDWDKRAEAVASALAIRCANGARGRVRITDATRKAAEGLGGLRSTQLLGELLRGSGMDPSRMSDRDIIAAARGLHRRGAPHSTSDFPSLLANVAGKILNPAYGAEAQNYARWSTLRTVRDFKPVTAVRLSSLGNLEKVAEGGEITYGGFSDGAESMRAYRYAKGIVITDDALVNDDLGGIGDVLSRAGLVVARSQNYFAVQTLLQNSGTGPTMSDTNAFFDATNHGNYITASGVPSQATLAAARLNLRTQTDDDGTAAPSRLTAVLLPAALEETANLLFAPYVAVTAATSVESEFSTLERIVEPELDAAGYAVAWYGLDTAFTPWVHLELEGETTPMIETFQESDTFGTKIRISKVFGFGARDWRGMVRHDGNA